MRKIAITSILCNIIFLLSSVWFYKKYEIKKEIIICKNKSQVHKKELKISKNLDTTDPIYIYHSKKFHCDSANLTYPSNICIGEKLQFADSLLNQLLKSKLNKLDKFIKIDKEVSLKDKGNVFFIDALKINTAYKENLLKSQKLWEQMRLLNSENVRLGCNGATGCSGIISKSEINYILQRIEELKELEAYN